MKVFKIEKAVPAGFARVLVARKDVVLGNWHACCVVTSPL